MLQPPLFTKRGFKDLSRARESIVDGRIDKKNDCAFARNEKRFAEERGATKTSTAITDAVMHKWNPMHHGVCKPTPQKMLPKITYVDGRSHGIIYIKNPTGFDPWIFYTSAVFIPFCYLFIPLFIPLLYLDGVCFVDVVFITTWIHWRICPSTHQTPNNMAGNKQSEKNHRSSGIQRNVTHTLATWSPHVGLPVLSFSTPTHANWKKHNTSKEKDKIWVIIRCILEGLRWLEYEYLMIYVGW